MLSKALFFNLCVIFLKVQAYVPPGTCLYLQPLTTLQAQTIVCSQAVTYQYFLPTGVSQAQLNSIAISKLNSTQLTILPTSCQAAFINLICSSVYLKCMPGVDLTTPTLSTWNTQIYPSSTYGPSAPPLPFQQPCVSVCNAITPACMGLNTLFGQSSPSCTARYDYSGGKVPVPLSAQPYQYDQNAADNPNICNPMSPLSSISVASTSEPYTGSACSGITTSLWVPPANIISNGLLAPLQGPGVSQSLIEPILQTQFSTLPAALSQDCNFALRKYFCASSFYLPQQQVLGSVITASGISLAALQQYTGASNTAFAALMAYSFALPSYPSQQVPSLLIHDGTIIINLLV